MAASLISIIILSIGARTEELWVTVIAAPLCVVSWMIGARLVALSEWHSLTVSRESVCLRRFLRRKKVLSCQDVTAWGFSADTVILDRSMHRACYRFYFSPVRLKRIGKLRRDFRKKRGILMISLWPREAIALHDSGVPDFCAACLQAVRETPPPMDVSDVERIKKYYP